MKARQLRAGDSNQVSPFSHSRAWLGANNTDFDRPVWIVPFDCTLRSASFASDTTAAASGTNYYSLVLNDGTNDLTSALSNAAVAFTADTPRDFVITAANVQLSKGDYVRLVATDNGSSANWSAVYLIVMLTFTPR